MTTAAASPAARLNHLSHSRINRYLHCPEQYRLYYVELLRLRHPSSNLVFGQAIHQALAGLFQDGTDPTTAFKAIWDPVREATLTYGRRDSWESLGVIGQGLLKLFSEEALSQIDNVEAVERRFELNVTGLDLPIIGFVDLVAKLNGKTTVVDFKTSASRYGTHEVELTDQLTAYQLAEPDVEQTAFCVLVKTKAPRIDWHVSSRNGDQLDEYLAKVRLVSTAIQAGHFFKRPGMWCSWCDYLPVCTNDRKKAAQTLLRIEPTGKAA